MGHLFGELLVIFLLVQKPERTFGLNAFQWAFQWALN